MNIHFFKYINIDILMQMYYIIYISVLGRILFWKIVFFFF